MNPIHFSTIARYIIAKFPAYQQVNAQPEQLLHIASDQGAITIATTNIGIKMELTGSATEVTTALISTLISAEIRVNSSPDGAGPADMVFVHIDTQEKQNSTDVSFKCVYLPIKVPNLY